MNEEIKKAKVETVNPWYKEPWPWILIALPAIAVVACVNLFFVANNTTDSLVTDDYYKEGKNIIFQKERDQYALDHQISAQVYLQEDKKGLMVLSKGAYDTKVPLKLMFIHPTIKTYDTEVVLIQDQNNPNHYEADLVESLPSTNKWKIRLADEQNTWRLDGIWLPSQGDSIELSYKNNVLLETNNQ